MEHILCIYYTITMHDSQYYTYIRIIEIMSLRCIFIDKRYLPIPIYNILEICYRASCGINYTPALVIIFFLISEIISST